jgi:ABC-type multidrug transport system ATPase subunit
MNADPSSPSSSPSSDAVEAIGICRRYGRRWALVDVGFTVRRGESLVLAGRNGSGKSTLLRVLSTAIRADRGTARIEGFDLQGHRQEVRRRTALLGHHSNFYEALTALENLQVAARFLGRDVNGEALLVRLGEVGLADRADDAVATFSAGMRKRLMLARTLLQEASVVFLDEPYGHLDPPGFRLVDDTIDRLRARGTTVVIATHLLERGAEQSERALVLESGRVAWQGQAADLTREGGALATGLPRRGGG